MHADPGLTGSNRSSPSGQSDKVAGFRFGRGVYDDISSTACVRTFNKIESAISKVYNFRKPIFFSIRIVNIRKLSIQLKNI